MDKQNKLAKPFYKRVWLWIIIVVVLIVVGSSLGSKKDEPAKVSDSDSSVEKPKEEEKTTFNTGETIEFDGKKVTVSASERNWNSGNQFITPNSGNEFVKVQVTIENNSDSEASYNTFDWKIQDSNGVIKDVAGVAFSVDGALSSGTLAKGGKVSGFLVFEVPSGDENLTLQYSPTFWTDKKLEIKI